jgi:CheY-like chemotaxis protein
MAHRILLADDSLTIQKVVELTFGGGEFELMAVGSGDRATAALEEFKPDIVLADAVMPGLSGYEVCEAVKRLPGGAFIPVILLTGTFEPFDRARADRIGADGIVTKPFDSQALASLVRDLIQKAATARTAAPPAPPVPPPAPEPGASEESTGPLRGDALYATTAIPIFTEEQIASFKPPAPPAAPAVASGFLTVPAPPATPKIPEDMTAPMRAYDMDLGALEDEPPRRDLEEDIAAFERSGHAKSRPDIWEQVESFRKDSFKKDAPKPMAAAADALPRDLETIAAETSLTDLKKMIPEANAPRGPLSDEDVDRIARRVVELVGERVVRKVAWEVVPEMAERFVRERLQELERAD